MITTLRKTVQEEAEKITRKRDKEWITIKTHGKNDQIKKSASYDKR